MTSARNQDGSVIVVKAGHVVSEIASAVAELRRRKTSGQGEDCGVSEVNVYSPWGSIPTDQDRSVGAPRSDVSSKSDFVAPPSGQQPAPEKEPRHGNLTQERGAPDVTR